MTRSHVATPQYNAKLQNKINTIIEMQPAVNNATKQFVYCVCRPLGLSNASFIH